MKLPSHPADLAGTPGATCTIRPPASGGARPAPRTTATANTPAKAASRSASRRRTSTTYPNTHTPAPGATPYPSTARRPDQDAAAAPLLGPGVPVSRNSPAMSDTKGMMSNMALDSRNGRIQTSTAADAALALPPGEEFSVTYDPDALHMRLRYQAARVAVRDYGHSFGEPVDGTTSVHNIWVHAKRWWGRRLVARVEHLSTGDPATDERKITETKHELAGSRRMFHHLRKDATKILAGSPDLPPGCGFKVRVIEADRDGTRPAWVRVWISNDPWGVDPGWFPIPATDQELSQRAQETLTGMADEAWKQKAMLDVAQRANS